MEDTRTRTKCLRSLPLNGFRRHRNWGIGWDSQCKDCVNAQDRLRRQARKLREAGTPGRIWQVCKNDFNKAAIALNQSHEAHVVASAAFRAAGYPTGGPVVDELRAAEAAVVDAERAFQVVARKLNASGDALVREASRVRSERIAREEAALNVVQRSKQGR